MQYKDEELKKKDKMRESNHIKLMKENERKEKEKLNRMLEN